MSTLTKQLKQQIAGFDLRFITESGMLAIGIAIARVLGFGFSFILARRLEPESFGYIQYTITLAGIVAIGTQPFVQHVLARFVGKEAADQERLAQTLHAIWYLLLGITALTVIVVVPLLLLGGRFSVGVMVIFFGLTLFYSYYGLARGFMASRRLLIAYLGSNVVQIIAIVIVYQFGRSQSPMPALLIYGLSYLLPIAILQVWKPLPLHFHLRLPDKAISLEVLRFSIPIWISHAAYIFYAGVDILLIERHLSTAAVGTYTLTKTISAVFGFVPLGLITLLLPKVASLPKEQHASLLKRTLLLALLVNSVVFTVYALAYSWFIETFFGPAYLLPLSVMLMIALSDILFGFHGIITAVVVGANHPQLETISRVVIVVFAIGIGSWLIPRFGLVGAGMMMFGSGIVSILTYVVAAVLHKSRNRTLEKVAT